MPAPQKPFLDLLIREGKKDRDDCHLRGYDLDVKRAVASYVTKLEEAEMWLEKAKSYYETR